MADTTGFLACANRNKGDESTKTNPTSDRVAREEGLEITDLHAAVAADRVKLQGKDGVHFSDEGATILGNALAAALAKQLKPPAGALR